MTWIDRLAVVWGCVAAGLLLLLYSAGGGHPIDEYFYKILAIMVGVPWGILRGLRWVVLGSLR